MIRRLAILMCVFLLAGGFLCSCDNEESPIETEAIRQTDSDVAKTVSSLDECRQEAAEDITEENAEKELQKLQKEIDSDL